MDKNTKYIVLFFISLVLFFKLSAQTENVGFIFQSKFTRIDKLRIENKIYPYSGFRNLDIKNINNTIQAYNSYLNISAIQAYNSNLNLELTKYKDLKILRLLGKINNVLSDYPTMMEQDVRKRIYSRKGYPASGVMINPYTEERIRD